VAAGSTAEAIGQLIERNASVIVLTETGTLPPTTEARLAEWVEGGGTLVRFASPRMNLEEQALLPLPLREGERALGGSLSWETPQAIGGFSPDGPFARIPVPTDVTVSRQVLAEPDALGQAEAWATLADGTPLVTAAPRGDGRLVLFHVTADPRWSNLPLSGAFVEMLSAIVTSARGTAGEAAQGAATAAAAGEPAPAEAQAEAAAPWRPTRVLDGFGRLAAPPADAALIADIAAATPGPSTPPGYYDRAGLLRALNTVSETTPLRDLDIAALGWTGRTATIGPRESVALWPWLLAAAALLAILDGIAVLALAGRLVPRRAVAAGLGLAAALSLALPGGADAQENVARELEASLTTRLAYVVTGDAQVDETSAAGLTGLTQYIASRTALEPGAPLGVDLGSEDLTFYALLYWPISAAVEPPPADIMAKVDAFLKNGGTILFDTRDAGGSSFGANAFAVTPETSRLRQILENIDVPPLEPVPPDHVLTKAFYLLREFPGRWAGSELWVEAIGEPAAEEDADRARPARGGDGVSPIIITGADFAGAWAIDEEGRFLYPTVPADPQQREMAFRAGVNIVMYTLTGNYKTDQVHVPALLERLGQ